MDHIKTPFFDKVDREKPLNEYPRPQFVRDEWINLNGQWDFCVTDEKAQTPTVRDYDRKILVPFADRRALRQG